MIEIETAFREYIQHNLKQANELKTSVNSYFRMLNLIEFVIEPPTGDTGAKYNILKEIEKRNKQEEKIKEQIEAFEKLNDFSKLFTQYTIRNRNKLNVFFLPETKGNSSQLFDDFDRAIASGKNYKIEDMENQMAAEP